MPAGNPDGGQWTSGESGGGDVNQDVRDQIEQALTSAVDQEFRDDLRQLEAIANDGFMRQAIEGAWSASNPDGTLPQEHGFWISRNPVTGEVFQRPFASRGVINRITPGPAPNDAVAFFHTHPNKTQFGYRPEPSVGDQDFAVSIGLPGLLRSHNGMYYFGPLLSR